MNTPQNIADLIRNPEAIREAFEMLRALRQLSVVDENGIARKIQFSPQNAIIDLGGTVAAATSGVSPSTNEAEVIAWEALVSAIGGTLESDSVSIANELVVQLKASSLDSKIVYLLPLLGSNLAAARCPLIDTLAVGAAASTGFSGADFSQATGLKGGTSKRLDLLIKASQLGAGGNGGLGYWENDINLTGTSVQPMGSYGSASGTRFVLDLRSNLRSFRWGGPANAPGDTTAAGNGHYYGQRSSATLRELFFNASSLGTNTTSDSASESGLNNIQLLACNENGPQLHWNGRCAVAYLTDGTLTSGEVATLHSVLSTYLITPTGR